MEHHSAKLLYHRLQLWLRMLYSYSTALNICFFLISNSAGRLCSSLSGIDLLVLAVLTSCISFGEIASEEMFTNFNIAPSFFFNSSFLTSLFFLKENPLSFPRYICRLKYLTQWFPTGVPFAILRGAAR